MGEEEGLGVLQLAVIGDDRDAGVDGLLTDGRIATGSWALMTMTLTPAAISDSTFAAWVSGELGIVAGVLAPTGLDRGLEPGLVAEAVALLLEGRPGNADMAAPAAVAAGVVAAGVVATGPVVGAVDAVPPPQAANTMATTDRAAADFRMLTFTLLLKCDVERMGALHARRTVRAQVGRCHHRSRWDRVEPTAPPFHGPAARLDSCNERPVERVSARPGRPMASRPVRVARDRSSGRRGGVGRVAEVTRAGKRQQRRAPPR